MWDIEFLILKRLYQENAKTQFFTKAAFKTIFEKGKEFNNHQRENPFETIDNFYSRDKFLSTVGDAPPKDEQSQYFLNDRGKIAYKIESDYRKQQAAIIKLAKRVNIWLPLLTGFTVAIGVITLIKDWKRPISLNKQTQQILLRQDSMLENIQLCLQEINLSIQTKKNDTLLIRPVRHTK